MKSLFGSHLELSAKVMDLQLKRQNVVMSNMSNVDTPNYKPLRLEFEKQLQDALNTDARGKLSRTDPKHMPAAFDPRSFEGDWEETFMPRTVLGEDRVDIDKEMALMAKNTMRYKTLATIVKRNFDGLNKVIREGQK